MQAILYLYRCKAKNWFRQAIKKPAKIIFILFIAASLIFTFISGSFEMTTEDFGYFKPQVPQAAALVAWGLAALIFFSLLYTATKSGSLVFSPADVHFIFTGPFLPQNVLLYGMLNLMGSIIFSTFFLLYQVPNLLRLGFTRGGIALTIFFYLFGFIVISLLRQALFLLISEREKLGRAIRILVVLLIGAGILALLFFFLKGGRAGELALFLKKPAVCLSLPVLGWWSRLLMCGWICFVLMLLTAVLSVLYSYQTHPDFYEEGAQQAEVLAAAKASHGERRRVQRKEKKVKLRKKGLAGGQGESTFFFLHLLEMQRKRPYLFGIPTAVYLFAAGILAYLASVSAVSDITAVYIFLWIGILIIYFFGQNTPLLEDLQQPVFYYAPGSSLKKILWVTLCPLLYSAFDILPGLILAAVFLDLPLILPIAVFLLVLSFSLLVFGIQLIVTRIAGTMEGTFATIIYLLLFYFLLLPGLFLSIISFTLADTALYSAVLLLLAGVVFHILLFILSAFVGVRAMRKGIEK